jgi:Pyridoxal-dependent decarboxylase conserved domain
MDKRDALRYRIAPLEMTPSEFRKVGRQLVERIAEFLCTLPGRPVTPQVLFLKRVRRPGTCSRKLPISCSSIPPSTAIRVLGTAGTVSTGAVDPLPEIASICREYDLWFHVDGAYGAFAALLLHENQGIEVPADLEGISLADSVAVDPHKWLYAPKEGLS